MTRDEILLVVFLIMTLTAGLFVQKCRTPESALRTKTTSAESQKGTKPPYALQQAKSIRTDDEE